MNYFNYAVDTMRSEAKRLNVAFPDQFLIPAPHTGKSTVQIRTELCAQYPDIWLMLQIEPLSDNAWQAIAHLLGRTNQISPESIGVENE